MMLRKIDIVMPMYNLIEYSDAYLKTSESLWQYFRDEPALGKYFWRTFKMPLINCECSLQLKWSKNCILVAGAAAIKFQSFN